MFDKQKKRNSNQDNSKKKKKNPHKRNQHKISLNKTGKSIVKVQKFKRNLQLLNKKTSPKQDLYFKRNHQRFKSLKSKNNLSKFNQISQVISPSTKTLKISVKLK